MTARVPTRPLEVLLVDDNPADARLIQEALGESGMGGHVHLVSDGEDAQAFLRQQGDYAAAPRPDLVLLDLNMRRTNGLTVLADMKANSVVKNIPVVILTSSRNDDDIARSYELGANCFVTKPVDLGTLIAAVRSVVEFWGTVATLPPKE